MSSSGIGPKSDHGFFSNITEQKLPHHIPFVRMGINPITTVTPETVWPLPGLQIKPSSAGVASVVSNSAADTLLGDGARQVTLYGLDQFYRVQTETIPMDGTTPVLSTKEFLRVSRIEVFNAASSATNIGNITASLQGNPQGHMLAGEGYSHNLNYTAPSNYWLVLTSVDVAVEPGVVITTQLIHTNKILGISRLVQPRVIFTFISTAPQLSLHIRPAIILPPGSDIDFRVTRKVGTSGIVAIFANGYLTSDPEVGSYGVNVADNQ